MSRVRGKRPSPSLVISILALFVALGGSAYAAGKIGTKNIKNNAVTAAKIKKNAVTTAKIKNGAVTGAKINAATLGTVPNATHAATADSATKATDATNATNAVNATNATNAVNFSRFHTSGLVKAGLDQTVDLGGTAPFTLKGHCEDIGGGEPYAYIVLTTSQDHSFMYSPEGSGYSEGEFNTGEEAELGSSVSGSSPEWHGYSGYYSDWTAASPDGSVLLQGFANMGVNVFGATCAFNAWWQTTG
jgi:hypothetical protein